MAFSKKPDKNDYPNTYSGRVAYNKAIEKWKTEGTTRTDKRTLAREEQIKVGGEWVNKADWTRKTDEALKIKPKFKNKGEQFTRSDTFAFKDKKKQKEYETGLAKIKAKETSGVGPVKSGAEYAKKLKGATKGVGPVKDGDTYAKGIKNSKTTKAPAKASEWKPSAIQKKLMKGGWTKEELQAKQKAHKQWKADRKSGKLKIKNKDRK